jgi:ribosome maturation factor RimP
LSIGKRIGPAGGGGTLHWREAVERSVAGMGYDPVDVERAPGGLLRVTIDRLPGRSYPSGGEGVTIDDCEQVTRQLQYALEVDGVDYRRLEVSSPGLDRPLRREADFVRHAGARVALTLKAPFQGRRRYEGVLVDHGPASADDAAPAPSGAAPPQARWSLVFADDRGDERVLGFALDEVQEARLVPVLDFKRRPPAAPPAEDGIDGDSKR